MEKLCIDPKRVFTRHDKMQLPAINIPGFRTDLAVQNGVHKNILFKCYGGIGDVACSEPAMRYALRTFKDVEISLCAYHPRLFRHLNFKKVYHSGREEIPWEDFFIQEFICDGPSIINQFISIGLTNCVDFASMVAYRAMLPVKDREIYLSSDAPGTWYFDSKVFIHPGRSWQSKTFPIDWWNAVIKEIQRFGADVVIIGGNINSERGVLDVDATDCMDLRSLLTIEQGTWLLQRAKVVITNDSAPLHLAASTDPTDPENTGLARTLFIATCKHPDFISHWRKGSWAWREKNLGLGGLWEIHDNCPNKDYELRMDVVPDDLLRSWLPDPKSVALEAVERL